VTRTTFSLTCPKTREADEYWADLIDSLKKSQYVGLTCKSCGRIHFVNRDRRLFAFRAFRRNKVRPRQKVASFIHTKP
jgi:uncharacterized OB-fold protein